MRFWTVFSRWVDPNGPPLGGAVPPSGLPAPPPAVAGVSDGFMSRGDKTKLDGIATGATNTPLSSTAPVNVTKATTSAGVATETARQDHKHDITTAAAGTVTGACRQAPSLDLH